MNRRSGLRVVFQVGEEIANGSKSQPRNNGILRFVDDIINLSWLKPIVEMNEMEIRDKLAIHRVGKTPLRARNYPSRILRGVAHRQNIFGAGWIIDRITFSARGAEKKMTKRHVIDSLRGGEIRTHEATNGLTTRLMSDRRKKPQAISSFGDVEFPTDPSDGVALAHKEAIAEFPFRIGGTYAIHDAQNSFSAAVRNFEEDRAVSFSHLLGPKEIEVSGKFDLSIRVARRFVDIDNLAVVDVRWVDRKIDATHDFFVGARRTNRAAILNVRARKYFDSRNVRRSARDRDQQQESIEKRDEASAQK